jgi:hypothetical protein
MALEVMEDQESIEKRIDREKVEAREKFKVLINLVNARYRSPESTIAGNESILKSFETHNSEILDSAIELGLKKRLDDDELVAVEIAAILHDLAKADSPPEESQDLENYVLASHHEMATGEIESILKKKHPEILDFDADDPEKSSRAEKIINRVKNAILCHMGPHPGFMADTLKDVNEELEKRGRPTIVHPKPNDTVSKILLSADMKALAGPGGIQKILNLRAGAANFLKEDEELCGEYEKYGISLSAAEAAIISASQSACDAVSMVKRSCGKEGAEWIQAAYDLAKNSSFSYSRDGQKTEVQISSAEEKMARFEKVSKYFEICDRIFELTRIIFRFKEESPSRLKKLGTELFGCKMILDHLLKMKGRNPNYPIDSRKISQFSQKIRELIGNDEFWEIMKGPQSSLDAFDNPKENFVPLTFAKSKEELKIFLKESAESLDQLALENFKPPRGKGH